MVTANQQSCYMRNNKTQKLTEPIIDVNTLAISTEITETITLVLFTFIPSPCIVISESESRLHLPAISKQQTADIAKYISKSKTSSHVLRDIFAFIMLDAPEYVPPAAALNA